MNQNEKPPHFLANWIHFLNWNNKCAAFVYITWTIVLTSKFAVYFWVCCHKMFVARRIQPETDQTMLRSSIQLHKHHNLELTNTTNSEQANQFPFVRVLQIIFNEHMHFHMPLQFWLNLSSYLAKRISKTHTAHIFFAYNQKNITVRQNCLYISNEMVKIEQGAKNSNQTKYRYFLLVEESEWESVHGKSMNDMEKSKKKSEWEVYLICSRFHAIHFFCVWNALI